MMKAAATLPTTSISSVEDSGPVVGVKTTRIYCRMVCRASRAPLARNCVPFLNTAAARAAGYRACKQCRPDDDRAPVRAGKPALPLAIRYAVGLTPVGYACVAATSRGVCALYLQKTDDPAESLERLARLFPQATFTADRSVSQVFPRVVAHLTEGASFDDLPLDLHGTPFQLKVWDAMRKIPRGSTTTYGALAVELGLAPGAARAVGSACGTNPVTLIVPCHRVLRSGGGLGGYYWGLDLKRALLDMEGAAVGE
jgi:AraC family transcriptional regulator of adaptative response/methylated-DNA-[protein]-cysteine methyltransferase